MSRRTRLIAAATVAILVVVAAVLWYVTLPRAGSPPPGQHPTVSLEFAFDPVNETVEVGDVSAELGLAEFGAFATRDNVSVGELSVLSDGATHGDLTFEDVDQDGALSVGDRFFVAPQRAGWRDVNVTHGGTLVGHYAWYRSPLVGFAGETYFGGGVRIDVAAVATTDSLDQFSAIVRKDGVVAGQLSSLPGTNANLTFNDIGGAGYLSAGDRFQVGSLDVGNWELSLYWRGKFVTSRTWSH